MTKTPRATKDAAPKQGVPKADAPKVAKAEAPPKSTKVEQPKAGHKPNALQQPLQPSAELAAVVGEGQMPRGEVVSKVALVGFRGGNPGGVAGAYLM